MAVIHSRLMKADYLANNSAIYPILVRAACAYVGVPYGPPVLVYCATRPVILDALVLTEDQALDEVLREFGLDPGTAEVMDDMVLAAVTEYKTKESE